MDVSEQNRTHQGHGVGDLSEAIRALTKGSHLLKSLQLIVDSHLLVSVTDRAGRIIYVNDRFCEVSKYQREELVGANHRILKSGEHPDSFYEELWSAISSGKTWHGDIQNKAKDGSFYIVQSTITPVLNEDKSIVGYASIRTDITDQRRLVADLKDKEKQAHDTFMTAINSLESSLSIVDSSGCIIATNKVHAKMYPDTAEDEQPGKPILPVIRKRRPDLSDEELKEFLEDLCTHDTSEQRVLQDGRTVQIRRTVLKGGGYVSLHTDITELVHQKKLFEEQAATMDLMKAIAVDANESPDAESAYTACLKRICKFANWQIGHTYLLKEGNTDVCYSGTSWFCSDEEQFAPFREVSDGINYEIGVGLPGVALEKREPVWIFDCTVREDFPRALPAKNCGLVGGAAFPVFVRGEIVAILEFFSTQPLEPCPRITELMSHVCNQVGRVAERERAEKQLMNRVAAELRKRDKELLEQNSRFDAALENMSQGLCMFDADQRLIVCNERYAQLYGLTSELVKPGTTLSEIVKHRIANGYYAGSSPDHYIQERQRWATVKEIENTIHHLNDGRSIAVAKRPLPGGGWVSTHEDITARMESENALRESQELFTKVFRASPAAMAISSPEDGAHYDVNETWMTMLGYSAEEAMAHSALELGIWADPEDRKKFVSIIEEHGSVRGFESRFRTKDGRELNVLVSGERVEAGGIVRLLVVSDDITERKKAEEALRESEKRFKNLVESTNVVPWEFDPSTMRFTYVGPQAVALLGYPVEDWYEEGFWQRTIHPDDREQVVRICTEATQECRDHDFEYRFQAAGGEDVWVRDVVSVVVEDGKAVQLRGVLFDISERKMASEALVKSEQRFKDIVEVSSDWIWECDKDLRFTYLSERFTEITGTPKEKILGRTRHEVGRNGEADWDGHMADLEARRPFREFLYSITAPDGSIHHWSISGRPVFDEHGEFQGYRGTGYDRTAEVEAEAELIRHRDHLQELVNEATVELKERAEKLKQALAKEKELNELQRQFVSMASHEFRTPLAIIDSAAQRLQRRASDQGSDETLKRVEKIRSAVVRMTQLMESTLVAARLESGSPNIRLENCDIEALLREVCDRQAELAPKHDIVLETKNLPKTIKADVSAIEQVFTNLLSNAVKYAPDDPRIEISANCDGQNIHVCVRDHGIGIDSEDLPKMFQRFFRASSSAGIAGTGIGLNLVKTLIELHEGSIKVESERGKGSLFTVTLPINGPEQLQTGQAA